MCTRRLIRARTAQASRAPAARTQKHASSPCWQPGELGFRPLAAAWAVPFVLAFESPDSGSTSSPLFPHTQHPPPTSAWPELSYLPTMAPAPNSSHGRARGRRRLDPWVEAGAAGGGRAGSKLSSDLCQASGRYKTPLGARQPQTPAARTSTPSQPTPAGSLSLLQTTPWGSATGNGSWC